MPPGFRHYLPWDALFTDLLGDTRRDERLAPLQQQQQQQQQQSQKGEACGEPSSSLQGVSAPAAPANPEEALNADEHLKYLASARFVHPVPSRCSLPKEQYWMLSFATLPAHVPTSYGKVLLLPN
eukprot:scaffold11084_cov19-Tisochrysis_lutea.AAC.5